MNRSEATEPEFVGTITHRVNYSETDQMGVVYHARYLVWLDIARTDYLRQTGTTYLELEKLGLRLMISEVTVKYRRAARYDDPIKVRVWVREQASRRVTFGYVVEHAESGEVLATATTALLVTNEVFEFARLPEDVAKRLVPIPDPVRL